MDPADGTQTGCREQDSAQQDAEASAGAAAPPAFCNKCGAPWDPDWITCPRCEAQQARKHAVQAAGVIRPIRSAIALYCVILSICVCAALIIRLGTDTERVAPIIIGADVVMTIVVALWCLRPDSRLWLTGLRHVGPARYYGISAVVGCVTFAVARLAVWLLVEYLHIPKLDATAPFVEAGLPVYVMILVICVQPAVIEEIAFRGITLGALQSAMNVREAVFVSTCMFAILHVSFLSIPHLVFMGLIAAVIRIKSGSLYPCMLMHFTHNGLVVTTELLGF